METKKITDFLPKEGLAILAPGDCGDGFEVTIVSSELDCDGASHGCLSMTPPSLGNTLDAIEREMSYPIRCAKRVTPEHLHIKTAYSRDCLRSVVLEFAG